MARRLVDSRNAIARIPTKPISAEKRSIHRSRRCRILMKPDLGAGIMRDRRRGFEVSPLAVAESLGLAGSASLVRLLRRLGALSPSHPSPTARPRELHN